MRGGTLRPQTSRRVRGCSYQIPMRYSKGYLGQVFRGHLYVELDFVIIAVINLFLWSYLHGTLEVMVGNYLGTYIPK